MPQRCIGDATIKAVGTQLHDAAEHPDGLLYPSRLLPRGSNLALYEHCSDGWQEEPLGDLMRWRESNGEPAVLEILDAHGWGLVD